MAGSETKEWASARAESLYQEHRSRVVKQTDRMFGVLMVCQWLFGMLIAIVFTPRTWIGETNEVHLHVYAAVLLGGLLTSFPVALAIWKPGYVLTRHVIAASQMLWSALLIHLMGGRIETHFHVFGSLAFIAFYRDWPVLLTATVIVAADHFLRGVFWPLSVYGIATASPWRWLEHAGWVVFEDIILVAACVQGLREMRGIAARRAQLEAANETFHESIQLLGGAADNLTALTRDQRANVARHAAALQQTHVTAQEIKQTSVMAAEKADAILKIAERGDEIGRTGETAIEQSMGGFTDMRAQVGEIAQKIGELSQRTRQIGMITETVKSLADQSNMLALNAAIEAVRSGEHGKGFAVVAREIRSLADQSIQSTNRVRENLQDIGEAIKGAVSITEQGSARMEGGLVQVRTSGEKLRDLSTMVKEISAAVRQIAAAVGQQNTGIAQIFTAVTQQTTMMDETQKQVNATIDASEQLNTIAKKMALVMNTFSEGDEGTSGFGGGGDGGNGAGGGDGTASGLAAGSRARRPVGELQGAGRK